MGARRRSRRRSERGAAMVEFALIVPVFLALVLAVVSYGYMLSYRQALSQAASESARSVAVKSLDDGAVEVQLSSSLSNYGVSCEGSTLRRSGEQVGTCSVLREVPLATLAADQDCNVSATAGADPAATYSMVKLVHDYKSSPLIPPFPGLGITLPDSLVYCAVVAEDAS